MVCRNFNNGKKPVFIHFIGLDAKIILPTHCKYPYKLKTLKDFSDRRPIANFLKICTKMDRSVLQAKGHGVIRDIQM